MFNYIMKQSTVIAAAVQDCVLCHGDTVECSSTISTIMVCSQLDDQGQESGFCCKVKCFYPKLSHICSNIGHQQNSQPSQPAGHQPGLTCPFPMSVSGVVPLPPCCVTSDPVSRCMYVCMYVK